MEIILLRHFKTEGNKLKRYIGVTDEPLCKEALEAYIGQYPKAELVFVSPMLRCRETCQLIYREIEPVICEELRECNFGRFENKNYLELSGDESYQRWIDSNGTMAFPEGESMEEFKTRTRKGFAACIREAKDKGKDTVAFVVHGGTIMSVMEEITKAPGSYYDWQVENGEGLVVTYENQTVRSIKRVQISRRRKED